MTKVTRLYRNEEIDEETFESEKEAEEYIDVMSKLIPEDYRDQLRFIREEEK